MTAAEVQKRFRVLAIEDDPLDCQAVVRVLEANGDAMDVEFESTLEKGLEKISTGRFDVMLLDLGLPDSSARATLGRLGEISKRMPVVVLTGSHEEDWGPEAIRAGAQDFLSKGNVSLKKVLKSTLKYAYTRHRYERELVRSKERFRLLVENSPDLIFKFRTGPDPGVIYANPALLSTLGYTHSQVYGKPGMPGELVAPDQRARLDAMLNSGKPESETLRFMTSEGRVRWVELRVVPVEPVMLGSSAVECFGRDVTARHEVEGRLEEVRRQLLQAQKMEAVGRLAGGVAHDFNNLLTVLISSAELLSADPSLAPESREHVEMIRKASQKGAKLTRQLLAFSRKEALEPRPIDLRKVVVDMEKLLRRLIPENITVTRMVQDPLWPVLADSGAVEQLLMNLSINAVDAMPDGGRLSIQLENETMFDGRDMVTLSIVDTGSGMDSETLSRAMEPYFTTKRGGEGSGLGLSTCYGLMSQLQGSLEIESEPGKGTLVRARFPRADRKGGRADKGQAEDRGGEEWVLLVEDDPAVLKLAETALTRKGYRVVSAPGGEIALEKALGMERLDVLVSDVVLPGMDGSAIAERLAKKWPQLKILFMSGYTADILNQKLLVKGGAQMLEKPFTGKDLCRRLRALLDAEIRVEG